MKFPVIPWLCNKFNQDFKHPKYLVRLCRRLTDFKLIINEAINCVDYLFSSPTRDNNIPYTVDGGGTGYVSAYSLARDWRKHAMGTSTFKAIVVKLLTP